ncbi:MAG: LytTR family transcriptional regulator DNA-binding domain-containing protein [Anaerorhabdus sp.]|uniref:LytTR family transcriptional regulator DNA-binding domain-containing protein n=1 Tax=Anaerorhabdus sp. TaxID=1872524 RepID=UPI003A86C012
MFTIAIVDKDIEFQEFLYKKIIQLDVEFRIKSYTNLSLFLCDFKKLCFELVIINTDFENILIQDVLNYISSFHEGAMVILLINNQKMPINIISKNLVAIFIRDDIESKSSEFIERIIDLVSDTLIQFKTNLGVMNISKNDIVYIETVGRKIFLHLKDAKVYQLYYSTLHLVEKMINMASVIMINRSVLININFVENYKNLEISMKSVDKTFILSKHRKEVFLNLFRKQSK